MEYAVVRINGNQHKVSKGDELLVDKLGKEPKFEVLLVSSEGKVQVGRPVLTGTEVRYKVLEAEVKGEKIDVFKFKAKARYRRKIGFRPHLTKIKIEKIST